jgi:hypothetical protein
MAHDDLALVPEQPLGGGKNEADHNTCPQRVNHRTRHASCQSHGLATLLEYASFIAIVNQAETVVARRFKVPEQCCRTGSTNPLAALLKALDDHVQRSIYPDKCQLRQVLSQEIPMLLFVGTLSDYQGHIRLLPVFDVLQQL